MSNTIKFIIGVVIALIVGFVLGHTLLVPQTDTVGAIGTKLAENYDPYLKINGGYYSNLPIQTNADVTVSGGTLTITSSNTATSTISVGCIQFYATSTATAQKFQASTTPGAMYSQYGTCPKF